MARRIGGFAGHARPGIPPARQHVRRPGSGHERGDIRHEKQGHATCGDAGDPVPAGNGACRAGGERSQLQQGLRPDAGQGSRARERVDQRHRHRQHHQGRLRLCDHEQDQRCGHVCAGQVPCQRRHRGDGLGLPERCQHFLCEDPERDAGERQVFRLRRRSAQQARGHLHCGAAQGQRLHR